MIPTGSIYNLVEAADEMQVCFQTVPMQLKLSGKILKNTLRKPSECNEEEG